MLRMVPLPATRRGKKDQLIAAATASLTYCIFSVVLLPNTVTEVTMTRNTSEAIRPYSMAVAPDSSRQNRLR